MNQEVLKAKQETVSEISKLLEENKSFVICEYRGLSVAQLTELRKSLLAQDSNLNVFKNTLIRKALAAKKIEGLESYLEGPNAFIFSKDISNGPKVIAKFARKNDNLVIKAGLIEGQVYGAKEVVAISKLPDKNGLISMLLSVLQAPVRQFAASIKAVGESKN